jgi:hypothetical protein
VQPELLTIILSILGAIGTWTITVALLVLWLANRFRSIERLIYVEKEKALGDFEREVIRVDNRLRHIERQIHRLQLKVFGFAPLSMDEMLDRLTEGDKPIDKG